MGVSTGTKDAINGWFGADSAQATAVLDAANQSPFLAGLLDAYVANSSGANKPKISRHPDFYRSYFPEAFGRRHRPESF
jgi:hypothetical protein